MCGVFLGGSFRAEGEVNLSGARIGESLECSNGQFINPKGTAFSAGRIRVEGDVYMRHGFKAEGEVHLLGARINGTLECINGQFISPKGYAFNAQTLEIEGNVFFSYGFKAEGRVNLLGAKIGGIFIWTGIFSPEEVTLDLRSARIGTLFDDKRSWPQSGNLFLNGLVYDKFDDRAPIDANSRINWLGRQPKRNFLPQPFEQLAAILRKDGHDEDAKKILITKSKDKAKFSKLTFWEKFWYHFFGKIIGFGYRPRGAFFIGLFIVAIGFGIFAAGYKSDAIIPTKKLEYVSDTCKQGNLVSKGYPKFNPLIYSLDVFIPLVDLQMASYWMPDAERIGEFRILKNIKLPIDGSSLYTYFWIHIILGWVLTTLWVVGLTGLIRS